MMGEKTRKLRSYVAFCLYMYYLQSSRTFRIGSKPKNDKLSFSKPSEQKPQQQIAATQGGKSVIINDTSSGGINQRLDQSKQNGMDFNDNSKAQITTTANQGKLHELKANIETSKIDDITTTYTDEKLPLHPSDKEQCSQCVEFTIPKEKYGLVRDAMNKSKASISVKFDGNKTFLGPDPDAVFDISGANHQDRNVPQIQYDDVAKDEEHFKRN